MALAASGCASYPRAPDTPLVVREASRLIYTHVLNRGPAGVTSHAGRVLDL